MPNSFIHITNWTTKLITVNGSNVNTSVTFTKTVKPSPSLYVTAGYRVDVDAPSYDGYTKFYESYVKATLSSAVDYDVVVSGRSILEAPAGETNAVGREPQFTIIIQKGTTSGEFILYQHPWIPLKVSVDSFTSNLKTTN